MSMLWLGMEPREFETWLELTEPGRGPVLRARLPVEIAHPRALAHFLESLSDWYGLALTAVLDADARDVALRPEVWARRLGEIDGERVRVEWTRPVRKPRRDRYLGALGDFRRVKQLVTFAGTGLS
jgi:hypothetical protein